MQAGAKHGMHTMDQHLAQLVRSGRITYETAADRCHSVDELNRMLGRANVGAGPTAGGMGGM
jgi:twitching motility protein PilT